jgi:hypothetical protein
MASEEREMRLSSIGRLNFGTVKAAVAVATLAAALALPNAASAALERVGPTRSDFGYPQWYQDSTGLILEFCSPTNVDELAGGYCLLLTGDTVAPESFPNQFADEHFYWAADNVGNWTLGTQTSGARLILGLEGAFAIGPVRNGDQIVFGRLRIRVDDLPLSGTYTVYTPYGKYVFPDQVAGDRLFFTEDIGINCIVGDFTCALQSSIGPFLLPSDLPGGAELPPVGGPDPTKLYIADPARLGAVTGSPLPDWVLSNGQTRNANVFVVEAPNGQVIYDSFNFTLMGRLFSGNIPGLVTADRASYSRSGTSQQIDTFASAFPTRQARVPATPVTAPEIPQLQVFSVPCGGTAAPFTAPAGIPVAMARNGHLYFAQTQPTVIPTHVCLEHTNARNTSGQIAPAYYNIPVGDKVNIAEATYDPDAKTLKVVASSTDLLELPQLSVGAFGDVPTTDIPVEGVVFITSVAAPPHQVRVNSAQTGTNTMQVSVTAGTGAGNAPPVAADDTATALSNVPLVIDVLANDVDPDVADTLTVVAVTQPANGTASFAGGLGVTYTANPNYSGPDAFTYTVSDGNGGFDTANVFVTVTVAPNAPPVATADSATTNFNTPVTIQVLVNDTDANGDPLSVVGVTQPLAGGVASFNGTSAIFTPAATFSGVVTFTYTVADTRGGQSTGNVTVTVRAQETIAFTRTEFRTGPPGEYRIDGTGTVVGSSITLRLIRNGNVVGVIATTSVDAAGVWTFRGAAPPGLTPVTGDRVRATSNLGTVREQSLTVRR